MSWLSRILGGDTGVAHADTQRDASIPGARLLIDHHAFALVELGVRSFRAHPYHGDLIERQNFAFTLVITHEGEEYEILGRGVVRQITEKGGLVAQFNAPQPYLDKKLIDFVAHTRSPHHLAHARR